MAQHRKAGPFTVGYNSGLPQHHGYHDNSNRSTTPQHHGDEDNSHQPTKPEPARY